MTKNKIFILKSLTSSIFLLNLLMVNNCNLVSVFLHKLPCNDIMVIIVSSLKGDIFMDLKDEQEKRQVNEYQKKPMINFADSINRTMIGDPESLTKGGCLTRIITTIILIGGLYILSRCS